MKKRRVWGPNEHSAAEWAGLLGVAILFGLGSFVATAANASILLAPTCAAGAAATAFLSGYLYRARLVQLRKRPRFAVFRIQDEDSSS
jgi:hypothetical protein